MNDEKVVNGMLVGQSIRYEQITMACIFIINMALFILSVFNSYINYYTGFCLFCLMLVISSNFAGHKLFDMMAHNPEKLPPLVKGWEVFQWFTVVFTGINCLLFTALA